VWRRHLRLKRTDDSNDGALVVRYYSDTGSGGPLKAFERDGRRLLSPRPGVWEIILRPGGDDKEARDLAELLGLFGFGVYV